MAAVPLPKSGFQGVCFAFTFPKAPKPGIGSLIMMPNPPLGVVLHAIGGLMSAIFYLPYRRVKHWSWESYWIVGGVFSWIVAPWIIAFLAVPNLLTTLSRAPGKSVFWSFLFGMLWGVGGATFGLTVRYLGFALGT